MTPLAEDLARTLAELVAALDRRTPRPEHPGEPAIAEDAALLRQRALDLLAKLAAKVADAPDLSDGPAAAMSASRTAFPATPGDAVALSIQEFTLDSHERDGTGSPTLERVCRTFFNDGNRALIWWMRFEALKGWCARPDVKARLESGAFTLEDAWDQAASFPLNSHWQFDSAEFTSAVESGSRLLAARSRQRGSGSAAAKAGAQ